MDDNEARKTLDADTIRPCSNFSLPARPPDTGITGKSVGWRRETRAAYDRTIDVCNAIDRLAIERIAIRHGDRDRDNARLTSLVPITHSRYLTGSVRIGSIDPPWKFRGEKLCSFALWVTRRNCGGDRVRRQWTHCAGDDRGMSRLLELEDSVDRTWSVEDTAIEELWLRWAYCCGGNGGPAKSGPKQSSRWQVSY